jgi:hypothetical protein
MRLDTFPGGKAAGIWSYNLQNSTSLPGVHKNKFTFLRNSVYINSSYKEKNTNKVS